MSQRSLTEHELQIEVATMDDPAPEIHVGDFVQARVRLVDDDFEVAKVGDVGTVLAKVFHPEAGWSLPAVQFERTGAIYGVTPDEVHVLAEAGFAMTPETTPARPRRVPLRRGKQ